jgi:bifunctional polynucleotide phosphatase/kinase
MNKSFYVGDALGRQGDWSDSDKKFAENIDIKKIYSPDDLFSIKNDKKLIIKEFDKQEIIVLVGYPGSGKTTIANTFDNKRYMTINGDIFKNSKNMIKESEKYIKSNYSIIFDATNPSIEKRKEYIDFAKSKNIPIRCINVETDIATSMFRNNKRDKVIPKITYYVFRKKYIKPTIEEGFYNVIDIS